jgi:hypothetical protein
MRATLVTGARLLCGWACAAVAVLDLFMGAETGLYLVFHLVLLAGGLLLLLGKPLNPLAYAVTTALAVLTTVVTALPTTEVACCMRGLTVRHGYPLTLLGWDRGEQRHFAPAHTVADLAFWFLAWMIVAVAVAGVRSRSGRSSGPFGSGLGNRRLGNRRLGNRRLGSRRLGSRRLPHPVLGGPVRQFRPAIHRRPGGGRRKCRRASVVWPGE